MFRKLECFELLGGGMLNLVCFFVTLFSIVGKLCTLALALGLTTAFALIGVTWWSPFGQSDPVPSEVGSKSLSARWKYYSPHVQFLQRAWIKKNSFTNLVRNVTKSARRNNMHGSYNAEMCMPFVLACRKLTSGTTTSKDAERSAWFIPDLNCLLPAFITLQFH